MSFLKPGLTRLASLLTSLAMVLLLSACSNYFPSGFNLVNSFAPSPAPSAANASTPAPVVAKFNNREKECLVRAMYFESNRSSEEGMFAVGTVVMNRVASPRFDNSICAVVGAPRQFAPGVLSRPMTEEKPVQLASAVADRLLRGERHAGVRSAKFFHQSGLTFPYTNMHYVLDAGGNAFYIKTSR